MMARIDARQAGLRVRLRCEPLVWLAVSFAVSLHALACTPEPSPRPAESATGITPLVPGPRSPRALSVRWVGDAGARSLPVVVLFHGWGAPADDLVPLGRRLHAQLGGEVRVALPAGPLPSTFGRAWWNSPATSRPADRGDQAPPGLGEARLDVVALLDQWVREGRIEPSQTVLAGFSQGGMLATEVGLSWSHRPAGVAAMSGGPIHEARWIELMEVREPPPFLMSHGRFDRVLAFAAADRLRRELASRGADVTWVPFDAGHEMPERVADALVEFLRRAL